VGVGVGVGVVWVLGLEALAEAVVCVHVAETEHLEEVVQVHLHEGERETRGREMRGRER